MDSPEGRKYLTPNGNLYESVTTFLGRMSDDGGLQEWRNAVGEKEANKVSLRASTRGSNIHQLAEQFMSNRPIDVLKTDFITLNLMKSLIPELKKINNIRLQESMLYSDIFKLAGTIDVFADYNGLPSIIDFKTANKLKNKYEIESYFLQASIYSYMIEERYNIKVPQIVIMIAVELSPIQVFIEDRKNYKHKLFELLQRR